MTSCVHSNISLREKEFAGIIGGVKIYNRLELKVPLSVIGGTVHEDESLILVNNSQEEIRFPYDFGVRIFKHTDAKGWIELKNLYNYYDLDPIIVDPRDEKGAYAAQLLFYPDLRESENVEQIRVLVVGEIYQNGNPTGEKVGAYIDMTVEK